VIAVCNFTCSERRHGGGAEDETEGHGFFQRNIAYDTRALAILSNNVNKRRVKQHAASDAGDARSNGSHGLSIFRGIRRVRDYEADGNTYGHAAGSQDTHDDGFSAVLEAGNEVAETDGFERLVQQKYDQQGDCTVQVRLQAEGEPEHDGVGDASKFDTLHSQLGRFDGHRAALNVTGHSLISTEGIANGHYTTWRHHHLALRIHHLSLSMHHLAMWMHYLAL